MPVEGLDVGVVGCGTAGAAAALLLARAGHAVTVYEAVERPGPVGAGTMLQPTGMAVLHRLGLLADVLARGAIVPRLRAVNARGWTVLDLPYARHDPRAFGLGLHRGVLFDTLLRAVQREPRVVLRCGVSVEGRRVIGGRVALQDASGSAIGDHALVVVADGARSALRRGSPLLRRERAYRWGAAWTVVPDPGGVFDGELFQVLRGTQTMLGFLPSGLGPSGDVPLVSVFWSLRADREAAFAASGTEGFWAEVVRLEPRARALLAGAAGTPPPLFAQYHDVALRPWHELPGLVFLGDAAHATSPQLGQGANLALVDAAVLADELAARPTLDLALAGYSARRRAPLGYYQWATRALTPFFQSEWAPLGWLRDCFMGLACRAPWVGAKMVRTMCGVERGLFAAADPLPTAALAALAPAAPPPQPLRGARPPPR